MLVGSLFALSVAFPSVRVADVLAIFGIVSVAAGFAFKDTFENLLAGVLLLLRDPFKSGDQVRIGDHEGTVEGVTVRETLLRGHDGRRYYIPNAKVMTGIIEVETDGASLRQSMPVSVDLGADLEAIRTVLTEALRRSTGVLTSPPPDVVLTDLSDGIVTLTCRFWSGSHRRASTAARDAVVAAIAEALIDHGVAAPVDHIHLTVDETPPRDQRSR